MSITVLLLVLEILIKNHKGNFAGHCSIHVILLRIKITDCCNIMVHDLCITESTDNFVPVLKIKN